MEIHLTKRRKGIKKGGSSRHSLTASVALEEWAPYTVGMSSLRKGKTQTMRNAAPSRSNLLPSCTQTEEGEETF